MMVASVAPAGHVIPLENPANVTPPSAKAGERIFVSEAGSVGSAIVSSESVTVPVFLAPSVTRLLVVFPVVAIRSGEKNFEADTLDATGRSTRHASFVAMAEDWESRPTTAEDSLGIVVSLVRALTESRCVNPRPTEALAPTGMEAVSD